MSAPRSQRNAPAPPPGRDGQEPAGGAPKPLVDPRLDELPFSVQVRRWAAAKGITTVRQLARVPPQELLVGRAERSVTLAEARAVLERFLGRRWEELAAIEEPGDEAPVSRRPASWDELRLVLPPALRALPLAELDLPHRMPTYAARAGATTLGDLAQRSAEQLLAAGGVGRISVRRLFQTVLALAEREAGRVAMPSPASIRPGPGAVPAVSDASGLLGTWRSAMNELPPELRLVVGLRAGLDGRPLTRKEAAMWQGVPHARIRREELRAVELLVRQPSRWVDDAAARFEEELRRGPVPLPQLAPDPWWAAAVALPDALDYFGEMVLAGQARVLDVDGELRLVQGTRRRPVAPSR